MKSKVQNLMFVMVALVAGIICANKLHAQSCYLYDGGSCRSSCISPGSCPGGLQCQEEVCNYQYGNCYQTGYQADCHQQACTYMSSDCPCFGFC
jgi:hypothetical protein